MSARRKQEEKNLQLLREQAALSHNKQCLDCGQRGPTYVNMTIGSFVCTSCSGRLRGLTPPHRVKSISMASFSAEEIEFIKQRGNEWCKAVWLGLFDPNRHPAIDMKDDSQIKDFMELKYEKKRYYVEPSVAFKDKPASGGSSGGSTGQPSPPATSKSAPEALPAIKPLSKLAGAPVKPIVLNNSGSSSSTATARPAERKNIDLLADLSPATSAAQGDPFSPTNHAATTATAGQSGGFANFANFDALNAAVPQPGGARPATSAAPTSFANFSSPAAAMSAVPLSTPAAAAPATAHTAAPAVSSAADRYAALKELDEVLKSEVEPKIDWAAGASRGSDPAAGGGWAAFGGGTSHQPASNGSGPYGQSPQQHGFPGGQFSAHAANGFSPGVSWQSHQQQHQQHQQQQYHPQQQQHLQQQHHQQQPVYGGFVTAPAGYGGYRPPQYGGVPVSSPYQQAPGHGPAASPDMSGLSGYGGVPTSSAGTFLPSTGGWPVPGQPAAGWGAPANPFMSNGGLAGSPANPHNPFL